MLCSAQQGFVLIVVLWYFRVAVDYYMPKNTTCQIWVFTNWWHLFQSWFLV